MNNVLPQKFLGLGRWCYDLLAWSFSYPVCLRDKPRPLHREKHLSCSLHPVLLLSSSLCLSPAEVTSARAHHSPSPSPLSPFPFPSITHQINYTHLLCMACLSISHPPCFLVGPALLTCSLTHQLPPTWDPRRPRGSGTRLVFRELCCHFI